MTTLQTGTIEKPLDKPEIARQVLSVLDRAWAMGFLPVATRVDPVSLPNLKEAFESVQKAGIGKQYISGLLLSHKKSPGELLEAFRGINRAMEESPNPDSEWDRLEQVLGTELLADLVRTSKVSVGRYKSKQRPTPPDIAARLHYLAMLIAELVGSYNQFGIIGWFGRKRYQLKDRSPRQLLNGEWSPESEQAKQVKTLAIAISGSPAT